MSIEDNLDYSCIGEVIDIGMDEYRPGNNQLIGFQIKYKRSSPPFKIQIYQKPTTRGNIKQMLDKLRDRKIIDPGQYNVLIDELREIPTAKK